ncbi:transcription antitermination factor NusB [Bacillus kwashiorkori]|uniref:transcription antitermination factor NusB n=1 Tax=Bacillus kwashiorkori TaxID=1522318 RepID=UPI0007824D49|nr:transcription antitermination factor NusB [Bacillus kwashiorkori]
MNRRTAREKALQIIFQVDVGGNDLHKVMDHYDDPFLLEVVNGTFEHLQPIDQFIGEHLEKWSFDRLANVDKNILRMATYEMKYMDEIPYNVTINEAVEIAKKFADEKAGGFINGVLSKMKLSLENMEK